MSLAVYLLLSQYVFFFLKRVQVTKPKNYLRHKPRCSFFSKAGILVTEKNPKLKNKILLNYRR